MCLNETYLNRKGITAPNSIFDTEPVLFIFLHLSFFTFFSISLATKGTISFFISVIFYSDLNPISIILQPQPWQLESLSMSVPNCPRLSYIYCQDPLAPSRKLLIRLLMSSPYIAILTPSFYTVHFFPGHQAQIAF
jgi:hypothetical protein